MGLALDSAFLLAPVSADDPCGEDLDEAGDLDFLNGLAHVEGLFPVSYLHRDSDGNLHLFDRSSIDFARESSLLLGLLTETRDLRPLTLMARLLMLNRDLTGFSQAMEGVVALLDARWDTVHPRGDGIGFDLRAAILQTLEDLPTVILPLQHLPLFHSRRLGSIDFRALMIADGEAPARSEEPGPDRASIERALSEVDPETLLPLRAGLKSVMDACDAITASTQAGAGINGRVTLNHLRELVGRIQDFLKRPEPGADTAATALDSGEAPEATVTDRAPAFTGSGIATGSQAASALRAAANYLRVHEPSSPSEVLVRQAQALLGKSFVEVMRILMPNQASDAMIVLGTGGDLRLSFEQLIAVPEDFPEVDFSDPEIGDAAGAELTFKATSRAEAAALLREVGNYLRRAQPASPIPLLLDKAIALAERDFLAILKDIFPEA